MEASPTANFLLFDGNKAFDHAVRQMDVGPRIPGSDASRNITNYILETLEDWDGEIQEFEYEGVECQNVLASRGENLKILLGAHYDCRRVADRYSVDADPVPGANDGASGVAVLLELGRVIKEHGINNTGLVFFDAEDQGRLEGWDWIVGSRKFVEMNNDWITNISAFVLVDMVGEAEGQEFPRERNSHPGLTDQIWACAAKAGYGDIFVNETGYSILDDHIPFIEAGIPSCDIIDFDYPWWHTLEDTIDKISAESLETVGRTLELWLLNSSVSELPTSLLPNPTGLVQGIPISFAGIVISQVVKRVKQRENRRKHQGKAII